MKKIITAAVLCAIMTASVSTAFASLDDNRQSIADQYGDYRMVIDTDNQLWTKQEWEQKGHLKAKAGSYMYSFSRKDLGVQMEVLYASDRPDAPVRGQRFTPAMPIQIKDFKGYFPEVYQLIASPKAAVFASYVDVTRQFQEQTSPVTLGVVIQTAPSAAVHKSSYTLIAFNIQDEGRLVKNTKYIDENTYIREFTIERINEVKADEAFSNKQWLPIKNLFI